MRILLVAPMVPDADGRGAIPVLLGAELLGLSERHEVTLITAVGDDAAERDAVARLPGGVNSRVVDRRRPPPGGRRRRRQARMALRWARGGWPWRTVWFADPGIQSAIDRAVDESKFDVVAIEDSSMSVFRYPAGLPTVYTHHEVLRPRDFEWPPGPLSRWPGQLFGEIDRRRWDGFQRRAWERFDRVQVFSDGDAGTIAELAPESSSRVRVNPFGCVMPDPADPAAEVSGTVLFVGNFDHPPNRDAATWLVGEIMPAVRSRFPGAILRIVGTAPPEDIRALAGPGVEVVGDAPSVAPHLEAAAIVMAPVRTGGGMRMKVLQAMALGRPVVTTPRGTEGYTTYEEPPLVVADTAAEIAEATAALLKDDDRRHELGRRAREFAERHHSPGAWERRLTTIYEEARGG
jgi:glycosyltransferase involved in cell wall biosynthesis